MASVSFERAWRAIRIVGLCWLVASMVSDLHPTQLPGLGPARVVALIAGYAAIAVALWYPRVAATLVPIVAVEAVVSGYFPTLLFACPFVVGALAATRRYAEAATTFVFASAVALYVAWGPADLDLLVWVLVPAMLICGALGVAFAEIWRRQRQAIEAAAAARTLAERSVRRERREIASKLHDEIGHAFALTNMIAGSATRTAEPISAAAFAEISQTCRDGAGRLSAVVALLRGEDAPERRGTEPPSELAAQLASTLERCGWRPTLGWDPALDQLPAALRALVERFLTEATTNVLKHARPRTALQLDGVLDGNELSVVMENDVAKQSSDHAHLRGLAALRDAAQTLDALVDFSQADGRWTLRLRGNLEEIFGQGFVLDPLPPREYDATARGAAAAGPAVPRQHR